MIVIENNEIPTIYVPESSARSESQLAKPNN